MTRHYWMKRHSLSLGGIVREWWTCAKCGSHRTCPYGNIGQSSYTYFADAGGKPDLNRPLDPSRDCASNEGKP